MKYDTRLSDGATCLRAPPGLPREAKLTGVDGLPTAVVIADQPSVLLSKVFSNITAAIVTGQITAAIKMPAMREVVFNIDAPQCLVRCQKGNGAKLKFDKYN